MPETEITIEGLDELIAKFKHIEGNVKPALVKAMDRSMKHVHSSVPPYPAPPPTSTYVRTELLGRSIGTEVKSLGAAIVGTIGTPTVYAPFVISKGEQAKVHRGRWWTLQQVVIDASDEILGFFQAALQKLLRS